MIREGSFGSVGALIGGRGDSRCWFTVMAYQTQCEDAKVAVSIEYFLPVVSNPRHRHFGEVRGVPESFSDRAYTTYGPADAVRSLNATRRMVAGFRERRRGGGTGSGGLAAGSGIAGGCGRPRRRDVAGRAAVGSACHPRRARVGGVRGCWRGCADHAVSVSVPDVVTTRAGYAACAPWSVVALAAAAFCLAFPGDGAAQGSVASDRAALEAFYDATGGASWTDSTNWKTTAPLSAWYGVRTDDAGRVMHLDLPANELMTGPIPAELGKLARLQVLALGGNALTGPIPDALGNLSNLRELHLGWNALTAIPAALGGLASLESLNLRVNKLTGPIPAALGSLSSLRELDLYLNELTGPVPAALGSLASLEVLDLGGNELTGPIPAALGNLTNLEYLRLGGRFTGSIPAELGSLGSLEHLDLAGNGLTGPIPAELGSLVNLRELNLWGNALTGPIPAELGGLVSLEDLTLSLNGLTGPIPAELGSLVNLRFLRLDLNGLTGPIPAELGSLVNLRFLRLDQNALTGPIPAELGSLANLSYLHLSRNWGVSGPLPAGLQLSRLEELDVLYTQLCAPAVWRDWLAAIDYNGGLCGTDFTIDVAVFYTPAAREAAGGAAEIEAVIDLMIAETNQAYAASGVHQRMALVERSEVRYARTDPFSDIDRLFLPSDGHLDQVHAVRDRVGADLVHLVVGGPYPRVCGIAYLSGAFGLTGLGCGSRSFAHELGHNMGLLHDRYAQDSGGGSLSSTPEYGYVNQRGLEAGAPSSSRWLTIMAYHDQCQAANTDCSALLRFSNPRQRFNGDPLGIPFGVGGSGLTGPADAVSVLNAMGGPAVAWWRERPAGANRPPEAAGPLPDRELTQDGMLDLDVSPAFADPDGDALSYTVSSSSPDVVTVMASGARVTLTAVGAGTATIRVTATDPGGLSATQLFTVTVPVAPNRSPQPVGRLSPLTLGVDETAVTVDVSGAFRDPDGDTLTYGARSSAPGIASVVVFGSAVLVTPAGEGTATVTVTATDAGGSNTTATQAFVVTVSPPANRPPVAVGTLAPLTIAVDEASVTVEVSGAFRDPDGDRLTYAATSSSPAVATAAVSGSTVRVTPMAPGTAAVTVTATDTGGSNTPATQTFAVTVPRPFTDHPLVPGVTPVKAVHFTELRARIDVLRREAGLAPFSWTDRVLTAGVTPVRLAHLLELREALGEAYAAAGRSAPRWTDAAPAGGATRGATPIRAVHLMELRAAVVALE